MDPELKDYLDGQFAELDSQFAELDGQFAALRGKISEACDENHQTRILVEKRNDKIDLVAEGVQSRLARPIKVAGR